jgi:transcriptional regulator with PAS, ATPase and Fis domain
MMLSHIATPESIKLLKTKYGIIGNSQLLIEAMEKLLLAAPTDITVLITGETGTGKEVFTNAIHGLSKRKKQPLISVNCGAIPETLLESELFGHEKGAFTGATDQRKGFFEVADKGTIFLDEIGEMPIGTQVKLLRVLESGEFTRLGSTAMKKVDVRVIAATNRDLGTDVVDGKFRQDLFFRLNSVHIDLPSLRQHPEDIKPLTDFFANKACDRIGLKYDGIAHDALEILKQLPWQGNIRELKNLIETLVTLEQETFITSDILKRYIPKALPERNDRNDNNFNSVIPVNRKDDNQFLGLEIIFRTLIDLKNEISDVKQMIHLLANQMEAIKVDILSEQSHHTVGKSYYDYDNADLNLFNIEKEMIIKALEKSDGNRRIASRELGISERTLYRKLQEYNLS